MTRRRSNEVPEPERCPVCDVRVFGWLNNEGDYKRPEYCPFCGVFIRTHSMYLTEAELAPKVKVRKRTE